MLETLFTDVTSTITPIFAGKVDITSESRTGGAKHSMATLTYLYLFHYSLISTLVASQPLAVFVCLLSKQKRSHVFMDREDTEIFLIHNRQFDRDLALLR